ncbi:MAG TPA: DUF1579 domain-containing protein [Caulobacteraceae bacterium]|nr:DUF1579 domain-containing protein [Caulobacteraceae bacterium]
MTTGAIRFADLAEPPRGAPDDFDFLAGDWTLRNRRLKARFCGSRDWEEFAAVSHMQRALGGVANVDEIVFADRGFSGMTVRLFDVEQRRWSIYWVNSRDGRLQPPVHGGFMGDRGEFFGEDLDDGRFVAVRFLWLKRGPHGGPRWEQAFSLDGREWETNWIMEFRPRAQ